MKVLVAERAGYCYGVERALRLTSEAVEQERKPIYTLGPIIHNPQVVEEFAARDVRQVSGIDGVSKGTIIVRTHGVDPEIIIAAEKKGLSMVDATCPFVAKAQQRAAALSDDGYNLVIVGEKEHPEVVGILAHAGGKATVVENVEEAAGVKGTRIGVVVQTTQSVENLRRIVGSLMPKAGEIKIFNTICSSTTRRQESAKKLAEEVGMMVVVGGKNSANTSRLSQICRDTGTVAYHIETARELKPEWAAGVDVVGVTSGASTPEWLLQEVIEKLKEIG